MALLGIVVGCLACSNSASSSNPSDETPDALAAPSMSNCELVLGSERPCSGLLPECPLARRDAEYIHVTAMTECQGEHFHELATIEGVSTSPVGFWMILSSGCSFNIEVDGEPAWPWLADGQQLDVEMWHAGGPRAGGSSVWITLKTPDTRELLLTVYQSEWQLIQEGLVGDLLSFDVDLADPICEDFAQTLTHFYSLRFHTETSSVVLGREETATLVDRDGRRIHVQTDSALYQHGHLVPPEVSIFDTVWGPTARFMAWPIAE
jgi:hypothetical protein